MGNKARRKALAVSLLLIAQIRRRPNAAVGRGEYYHERPQRISPGTPLGGYSPAKKRGIEQNARSHRDFQIGLATEKRLDSPAN